ncbi:MAG: response regulator [Fidelibacterota bacterium]|nr:MAG: response regulator [Candidatus Neomarinimicrobiota bacterium]
MAKEQQSDTLQSILIVDHDEVVLNTLTLQLQDRGWEVFSAKSSHDAIQIFPEVRAAVALVALGMSDMDGMELAAELRRQAPDLIVILMTGYPTLNQAIEGLDQAAYDYLVKPFRVEQLLMGIKRAQRELALIKENQILKQTVADMQAELAQVTQPSEPGEAEGDQAEPGEIPARSSEYAGYPGKLPGDDTGAIASYERHMGSAPPESSTEQPDELQETNDQEGEQSESDEQ